MILTVDLVFEKPFEDQPASALDLIFGADVPEIPGVELGFMLPVPIPSLVFEAGYDPDVSRPFGVRLGSSWEVATVTRAGADAPWTSTASSPKQVAVPWEGGTRQHLQTFAGFDQSTRLRQRPMIPWTKGTQQQSPAKAPWEVMSRTQRRQLSIVHDPGQPVRRPTLVPWEEMTRRKKRMVLPWEEGAGRQAPVNVPMQRSRNATKYGFGVPWNGARRAPQGQNPDPPVVPPEPPRPYITDLVFECQCTAFDPGALELIFTSDPCPGGKKVVPIREVYFVLNEIYLKVAGTSTFLRTLQVSVKIDRGSWAWSLSAEIAAADFTHVEPDVDGDPVEVELGINGVVWRFLVEDFVNNESFGKESYTLLGRSVTAWLSDPYAPVRSWLQEEVLTSRQIAEAELERPGLITGFTFDWQLVDDLGWSMPSGSYGYERLTPIQVINQVAAGVGGYVQSHPSDKKLIVLPGYRYTPWEMAGATPDLVLPRSYVSTLSGQHERRPAYNGVVVSGQRTGIIGNVKREGTAGDFQAPMVTDPFITVEAAARERGRAVLSEGGSKLMTTLGTYLSNDLGLITPGTMIEVTNAGVGTKPSWRGLIRSTEIAATADDDGAVEVAQRWGVERIYTGS